MLHTIAVVLIIFWLLPLVTSPIGARGAETKSSEKILAWDRESNGGHRRRFPVIGWASRQSSPMYQAARRALCEKCRRYVCLRTDRRRIRVYVAEMLANRPARGDYARQHT